MYCKLALVLVYGFVVDNVSKARTDLGKDT